MRSERDLIDQIARRHGRDPEHDVYNLSPPTRVFQKSPEQFEELLVFFAVLFVLLLPVWSSLIISKV
jgi:hypothetical protein